MLRRRLFNERLRRPFFSDAASRGALIPERHSPKMELRPEGFVPGLLGFVSSGPVSIYSVRMQGAPSHLALCSRCESSPVWQVSQADGLRDLLSLMPPFQQGLPATVLRPGPSRILRACGARCPVSRAARASQGV